MPQLLELVEPTAQKQVHDAVFVGQFRQSDEGAEDPAVVLDSLVHRCREEALDREIRELERLIEAAQNDGFPDKATELANKKLDLRRQQAALRRQPVTSGGTG